MSRPLPPPTSALQRLQAAVDELNAAATACIHEVFAADLLPEPYDDGILLEMLELLKDLGREPRSLLLHHRHQVIYQETRPGAEEKARLDQNRQFKALTKNPYCDPPGYSKGTVRFGPALTPEEAEVIRAGSTDIDEAWTFERCEQVQVERGILLYCWPGKNGGGMKLNGAAKK